MPAIKHWERSEDNFSGCFFFPSTEGFEARPQVVRLHSKLFYPLSRLIGPAPIIF